jgi:hypothetical protein
MKKDKNAYMIIDGTEVTETQVGFILDALMDRGSISKGATKIQYKKLISAISRGRERLEEEDVNN